MAKKDYSLSQAERETIIVFNAGDKTAVISSLDPVWQRKIEKLPGAKKIGTYVEAEVPKTWVKVSPPKKVSETQRAAARRNIAKLHQVK